MFLHVTPDNRSDQVDFLFMHNTQPLSHLLISPKEIVFHTQLRNPLNFHLNHYRNQFREITAQYCSNLHPHSHYQSTDIKPLINSFMLKPIFTRFLAFEAAMLQIYSKVYQYALTRNSLAYTEQRTPKLYKPLP